MRVILREFVLDITDKCPATCIYCSAEACIRNIRFMPMANIERILKEASELGLEILSLSGGEPLLHPHLTNIIRLAKKLDIRSVRLFTSGLHLKDNKITGIDGNLVKELKFSGLDRIYFNLPAPSEKAYEAITGLSGVYQHVLCGIKQSVRAGLYTGVHFVPIKPNYHTIADLVELCKRLGVDEIGVLRFVPHGRGLANRKALELDEDEHQEFLRMLVKALETNNKPRIRVGCPFNDIQALLPTWRARKCSAARTTCHVLVDGSVAPCSAFKSMRDVHGGNAFEKGLKEIWRRGFPQFEELRKKYGGNKKCTIQEMVKVGIQLGVIT